MSKAKRELFRAAPSRGLKDDAQGVDRESRIIHGVSVISEGELLGHNMDADTVTLEQVVEHGNAVKRGARARFGHPHMSANAEGTFLGRFTDFRRDEGEEGRVRADLHLADAAFREDGPNGNLGEYVMDLADEDPGAFGVSVVVDGEREYDEDEDGNPVKNKDGKVKRPKLRVKKMWAADVVDEPATGDEMFAQTVKLSAAATEQLDKLLQQPDAESVIAGYLQRYAKDRYSDDNLPAALRKVFTAFLDGENVEKEPEDGEQKPEPEKKEDPADASGGEATEDHGQSQQKGEDEMSNPEDKTLEAQQEASKKEREELRKEAAAAERERIGTLQKLAARMGVGDEALQNAIDEDLSVEAATQKFLEIEQHAPPVDAKVTKDESDKFRRIAGIALSVDGNLDTTDEEKEDLRKSAYSGAGLQSFTRECLARNGVQNVHRLTPEDLYFEAIALAGSAAQGTADFTNVLANTVNKSLAKGWKTARVTYNIWCGKGSTKDFKDFKQVRLTEFADVEEIPEGEAPKMGVMQDTYESSRLFTVGKAWMLTRQAMINDDLSVFTRMPAKFAASVQRYINRYVYVTKLYGSSFAGPTMSEDSAVMFSTDRGNLASGHGGAIAQGTINTGYNAFFSYTALSPGDDSNSIYCNIPPRYLLFAPENHDTVFQLMRSQFYAGSGADGSNAGSRLANPYGPGGDRGLEPVEEVLLGHVDATYDTPWYLAADPNEVDTLSVYTLNGKDVPTTRSEPSRTTEAQGILYDTTFDFGVLAGDWRGMYCNKGGN